jgi:prepilin-type N-terminal cleavage/methylation domain-containing protein
MQKEGIRDKKQNNITQKKEKNVMKKMNNKGFSLVELIVVVLIMAIIAVALAPQVMKWVENSRKSTDSSNYDTIYSAANIALGDEATLKQIKTMSADFAIKDAAGTGSGYTYSGFTPNYASGFAKQMVDTLGSGWEKTMKVKAAILDYITPNGTVSSGNYVITVKRSGHVERTKAPYNPETK